MALKVFFFAMRKCVYYIKLFILFKMENVNACNFLSALSCKHFPVISFL